MLLTTELTIVIVPQASSPSTTAAVTAIATRSLFRLRRFLDVPVFSGCIASTGVSSVFSFSGDCRAIFKACAISSAV